jgi:SAM-dependent methyltransferase
MKNPDAWRPSKYVFRDGRLMPSRDPRELSPASRYIGYLLAVRYQQALALHARGRLLDLGCGKVPFYEAYRPYVEENVCVDWSSSLHANCHVDRICDLTRPLPFDTQTFDTVLSSDVLEHLPDAGLACREIGRILKPGGVLILNTPFLYMLHEVPYDYYRHTRYSLERLAAEAGLEIVDLVEIGGLPDVLVDLVAKGLVGAGGIGTALAGELQRAAMRLHRTAAWQRLSTHSAPRFPLGYFLIARKRDESAAAAVDGARGPATR